MQIRGLIFDFDGIILDTETPEYQSWLELFQEFGKELPVSIWTAYIGAGRTSFDPLAYLKEITGLPLPEQDLQTRRYQRAVELQTQKGIYPGVVEYLQDAKRMGLKTAVASSSDRAWVGGHLSRLGLMDFFDAVLTADDVSQVKPEPELFLKALKAIGLEKDQALVFEDSPNGILAAKRAGIRCICVPNEITREMDTSAADDHLPSLAAVRLADLLQQMETPV